MLGARAGRRDAVLVAGGAGESAVVGCTVALRAAAPRWATEMRSAMVVCTASSRLPRARSEVGFRAYSGPRYPLVSDRDAPKGASAPAL